MGCSNSGATVREVQSVDPEIQSTPKAEPTPLPKKPVLPEIAIYYGTQTGNASRFAHELLKEAQERYELTATITDLGPFNEKELPHKKLAIFIVSTYGEGGPTDSSQRFYYWLINGPCIEKEKESFSGLRFAVFGCGDSNFKKTFNRMAKLTEEKMLARGAQKIFETGLGDDSKNLNADFSEWKAKLWPSLISFYQTEQKATIPLEPKTVRAYVSQFDLVYDDKVQTEYSATDYSMSTKQYLLSSIFNEEMVSLCYRICFDTDNEKDQRNGGRGYIYDGIEYSRKWP